jgi:hypothetical protein
MNDEEELVDKFMFQLAWKDKFEYFEHVYFFGSPQDTFVPYYSSRAQIFKEGRCIIIF